MADLWQEAVSTACRQHLGAPDFDFVVRATPEARSEYYAQRRADADTYESSPEGQAHISRIHREKVERFRARDKRMMLPNVRAHLQQGGCGGDVCRTCGGWGRLHDMLTPCPTCGGRGMR